jgi:hypothetical protein
MEGGAVWRGEVWRGQLRSLELVALVRACHVPTPGRVAPLFRPFRGTELPRRNGPGVGVKLRPPWSVTFLVSW